MPDAGEWNCQAQHRKEIFDLQVLWSHCLNAQQQTKCCTSTGTILRTRWSFGAMCFVCMLAHPHLQWCMRFWCAHLRRDMWKGQGQSRGHRGVTAALQGEVRTPPLFEWGTGGEPSLLVCPCKATIIPPLRMCSTFRRLLRSWEKLMQTCYSQNPTIQELWGFMKWVGGEFKADERKHFLTQQVAASCRNLLPCEVSEANSVSRFKSAYANFWTSP